MGWVGAGGLKSNGRKKGAYFKRGEVERGGGCSTGDHWE